MIMDSPELEGGLFHYRNLSGKVLIVCWYIYTYSTVKFSDYQYIHVYSLFPLTGIGDLH